MVLESTMICVDNSDYMRNGDFIPTRLQAQQEAVNLVCHSKTRSNPENNVGLLSLSNNVEVLATLTSDVGRILSKLHAVSPNGDINLLTGIRIAQLALKHRQGKNHKMRIVVFVGSPIGIDEKDLIKLAKKLKKEKVNVDIVSFGEEALNNEMLTNFVNTLNGKDGTGSHLVTVPPGPHLADALISSPVIQGEDGAGPSGAGFDFGVDPNEDPELALALRVSMEEQRLRQEESTRNPADDAAGTAVPVPAAGGASEEALLERALAMSMETDDDVEDRPAAAAALAAATIPDFGSMTEEEQIMFAMQMSMQDQKDEDKASGGGKETPMEVEGESDFVTDPEFIASVLETLPGVDPNDPNVRQLLANFSSEEKEKDKKEKDKK